MLGPLHFQSYISCSLGFRLVPDIFEDVTDAQETLHGSWVNEEAVISDAPDDC